MSILDELFEDMKNAYLNPPTLCEDKQKMDWEIAKLEFQKLELIEQLEEKLRKEDDGREIQNTV